jgi:hypothetical protein
VIKIVVAFVLIVASLRMPYQSVRAGYCQGVSKCAEWGLNGACSSVLIDAKVCYGRTEAECYADDVPCIRGCIAGSCTWVTESGDPTPTAGAGGGGASCSTVGPSVLRITRGSPNDTITWNPGYGGTSQLLLASEDSLAVRFNCSANGYVPADCDVFKSLANGIGTYSVPKTTFTDNTIYYVKVVEIAGVCSASTTKPWISTCSMTPASWPFSAPLQTRTFTVPVVDTFNAYAGFKHVSFFSNNTAVVTVNPAIDTNTVTQNELFRTVATAVSISLPQTSVDALSYALANDQPTVFFNLSTAN